MPEVRNLSGLQELTLDEMGVKLVRYLNTEVDVIKMDAHQIEWAEVLDEVSATERFLFFQALGSLKVGLEVLKNSKQTSNSVPLKNIKAWQNICNQFNSLQRNHLESDEMDQNTSLAAENSNTLFNVTRQFVPDTNHVEICRFALLEQTSMHLLTLQSFFTSVLEDSEMSRKVAKLEKQVKDIATTCLQGTLKSHYLRSSKLNWLTASQGLKKSLGVKVGVTV